MPENKFSDSWRACADSLLAIPYPERARLAQALPAFVAGLDLASDYEAHGAGSAGTLLFLQELSSEIGGEATALQGDRQADPAATSSG